MTKKEKFPGLVADGTFYRLILGSIWTNLIALQAKNMEISPHATASRGGCFNTAYRRGGGTSIRSVV